MCHYKATDWVGTVTSQCFQAAGIPIWYLSELVFLTIITGVCFYINGASLLTRINPFRWTVSFLSRSEDIIQSKTQEMNQRHYQMSLLSSNVKICVWLHRLIENHIIKNHSKNKRKSGRNIKTISTYHLMATKRLLTRLDFEKHAWKNLGIVKIRYLLSLGVK